MDPWNLLEAGRYKEAVDAYTKKLRREQSTENYCAAPRLTRISSATTKL